MLSSEILAKVTITPFRINLKFMRSSPFAYLARAFLMSVRLLAKKLAMHQTIANLEKC